MESCLRSRTSVFIAAMLAKLPRAELGVVSRGCAQLGKGPSEAPAGHKILYDMVRRQ